MIDLDYTITVGNIITVIGFIGSGIGIAWKVGRKVDRLTDKVELVDTDLFDHVQDVKENMKEVKGDIKNLSAVLITIARQEERLNSMDTPMGESSERTFETLKKVQS